MLKNAAEIIGMSVETTDGKVGKVKDLLVDDRWWTIRYLVTDTGSWLSEHKVLVSPQMIVDSAGSMAEGTLYVRATKKQIEDCPPLDRDATVSRRYEREYARYYRQSPYWFGSEVWGVGALPDLLPPPPEEQSRHEEALKDIDNCHLFSTSEMMGFSVEHADGSVQGTVEDFVVVCRPWLVRWLVLDLGGWFNREPVCIPRSSIRYIDWLAKRVVLTTTLVAPEDSDDLEPAGTNGFGVPATPY